MVTLLKSLVGSRLHGLYTESSDYDYKSILISPIEDIISPFKTQKGKTVVTETEDICNYELVHFAKLLGNCNPTILEMLWSTNIEGHPLAQELLLNKKTLLHKEKVFFAHRGYASAQRGKMSLDAPNTTRTAKAIIAYIRIMQQGISLLKTGDFDPVISPTSKTHKLLMEIKENFDPKIHISWAEAYIETLEKELQTAYDECKIQFNPCVEGLEKYIAKVYLELGKTPDEDKETPWQKIKI